MPRSVDAPDPWSLSDRWCGFDWVHMERFLISRVPVASYPCYKFKVRRFSDQIIRHLKAFVSMLYSAFTSSMGIRALKIILLHHATSECVVIRLRIFGSSRPKRLGVGPDVGRRRAAKRPRQPARHPTTLDRRQLTIIGLNAHVWDSSRHNKNWTLGKRNHRATETGTTISFL